MNSFSSLLVFKDVCPKEIASQCKESIYYLPLDLGWLLSHANVLLAFWQTLADEGVKVNELQMALASKDAHIEMLSSQLQELQQHLTRVGQASITESEDSVHGMLLWLTDVVSCNPSPVPLLCWFIKVRKILGVFMQLSRLLREILWFAIEYLFAFFEFLRKPQYMMFLSTMNFLPKCTHCTALNAFL